MMIYLTSSGISRDKYKVLVDVRLSIFRYILWRQKNVRFLVYSFCPDGVIFSVREMSINRILSLGVLFVV